MRTTSSWTQTGSVVLIRLVTSKSLRRKFIAGARYLLVICPGAFADWNRFACLPQVGLSCRHTSRRIPPMATMTLESGEEIKRRISELNLEHRDLDRAIEALE